MTDNKALAEHIRNYLESGVDLLLTDDDYRAIIKALEQESKTGYWIQDNNTFYNYCKCSVCGKGDTYMKYRYCPNCGARMSEASE